MVESDWNSPGLGVRGGVVDPGEVVGKARGDRYGDDLGDSIRVQGPDQGLYLREKIGPSLPDKQNLPLLLDLTFPPEKGSDCRHKVQAGGKSLFQKGPSDPLPLLD